MPVGGMYNDVAKNAGPSSRLKAGGLVVNRATPRLVATMNSGRPA